MKYTVTVKAYKEMDYEITVHANSKEELEKALKETAAKKIITMCLILYARQKKMRILYLSLMCGEET
jgi:hypothetical protein